MASKQIFLKSFSISLILILLAVGFLSPGLGLAQGGDTIPDRGEPPAGEEPVPPTYFEPHQRVADSVILEGDIEQLEAEKRQALRDSGIIFEELPAMETFIPPPLPQEAFSGPSDDSMPEMAPDGSTGPGSPYEKEGGPLLESPPDSSRAVNLASPPIYVAHSTAHEWWPAVAHGGGRYMVVYVREDNIYAKVYSNAGVWQNTITVAVCGINGCGYPSVAYEAQSGLFLVAYEYYSSPADADIYIRAVSPVTGNRGSSRIVADSVFNEWYPSVACKYTDGTCLVAFQHNQGFRIKGRFFTITGAGISAASGTYDLTNATGAGYPHLAWSKDTGLYMVTYNWWDNIALRDRPRYTKVYDYPVAAGNQYVHLNATVIPGASIPAFPNHAYINDVAYDPCTQHFVVIFQYDYGPDFDIWAVAKQSGTISLGATPFSVAATIDDERAGKISFVTDNHINPHCGSMDKLVVAYTNATSGIKAADLRGNNDTTNPVYVRDAAVHQLVVEAHTMDYKHSRPAITSAAAWGEMLIAYQPNYQFDPWDGDISARLVHVRTPDYTEPFFLPLLVR